MMPRILSFNNQADLIRQLRNIKVDEYGIKIMSPKADFFLIKVADAPSIAANILKQEMLSLGGDVAISRNSITGKDKKTDCLLMGNFIQLKRLITKLKMQPFKLDFIGRDLEKTITNYKKEKFLIKCADYVLHTEGKTLIMGIINLTRDSFSCDGLLRQLVNLGYGGLEKLVLEKAEEMIKEGADIIDLGAESTRPGARPLGKDEEIKRLSACLKALVKEFKVPISVDTYKPDVAKAALDLGASIINDVTGLRNPEMKKLVAKYRAGTVIMHMKGSPRTMQKSPKYQSLIDEIISFLASAVDSAVVDFGISADCLIIDPGIGFGKTLEHNLEILRNLNEFKVLGRPILVGVSRKSFIGKILNVGPQERIFGTAAAAAVCIKGGCSILRVHDVKEMRQIASVCDALTRKEFRIAS